MKNSLKLLLIYIACCTVTVLLSNVLPAKVAMFFLLFFFAGFPFWLFVIGVQALSEMK